MAARQGGHFSFRERHGKREQALTQRTREPEEENDPASIRASARVEFRKFAPPRCADIEDRIEKAVEKAGVLDRLKDRKKYIQKILWNARCQAALAWQDLYRDLIHNKLGLEDLRHEHEQNATPAKHAALLRLKPEEQWVYLLRTRHWKFSLNESMKITGLGKRKVDRILRRAEQRINL